MSDFEEHYTLITDKEGSYLLSIDQARTLANGDEKRVWFVRERDEEEDDDGLPIWTVEPWRGQFVNCVGFFISAEPCLPEHSDSIFTY